MGNQREYIPSGGFSQYLYKDESPRVTINGVTGKMISMITDPTGTHAGLPTYANTSDIYFKKGNDGLASQAKVYIDRKTVLDFDWNHDHQNSDGRVFHKGTVHVQTYRVNPDGSLTRLAKKARFMNNCSLLPLSVFDRTEYCFLIITRIYHYLSLSIFGRR